MNQSNNYGATPLFVAAQNGHMDVVQALLEHNADVKQANKKGATPLYVAAENRHKEICILLRLVGAEDKKINELQINDEGVKSILTTDDQSELLAKLYNPDEKASSTLYRDEVNLCLQWFNGAQDKETKAKAMRYLALFIRSDCPGIHTEDIISFLNKRCVSKNGIKSITVKPMATRYLIRIFNSIIRKGRRNIDRVRIELPDGTTIKFPIKPIENYTKHVSHSGVLYVLKDMVKALFNASKISQPQDPFPGFNTNKLDALLHAA